MNRLVIFLAAGCGLGFVPRASGTFGTLLGIPILFLSGASPMVAIFMIALGIWLCGRAEEIFGEHDDGRIVLDEIAGYLAASLFLPVTWPYALAAFALFRVFDITKPGPIGRLQSLPGGWGIMADDVAAGVAANIVLQLVRLFL